MPFLTVTGIGLIVGSVGYVVRAGQHPIWRGFFGAWAGFAAGGLVGIVADVTTHGVLWVPLLGHVSAAAAAVFSQFIAVVSPGEVGD